MTGIPIKIKLCCLITFPQKKERSTTQSVTGNITPENAGKEYSTIPPDTLHL